MEILNRNNVKIFDLSRGKSLRKWLKLRKNEQRFPPNGSDIHHGIKLFRKFKMPGGSCQIKISDDGQCIVVIGNCSNTTLRYDVHKRSTVFIQKQPRTVVQFEGLNKDFSKIAYLQYDGGVEFHSPQGLYYKTKLCMHGHDFASDSCSGDLYFVGESSEVYSFKLEEGRFSNSFKTDSRCVKKCCVSPDDHLFLCGTEEGTVEAWDHRMSQRIGIFNCAVERDRHINWNEAISALNFRDSVTFAAGTEAGMVLLCDLRTGKPYLTKWNMGHVRNVEFIRSKDLVASLDAQHVAFWDENTGELFGGVYPQAENLNDMCLVPNTGMLFVANEGKKILQYFIPSIGPAPLWCSALNSITEELEESPQITVYNDCKFITKELLEGLGLFHLMESDLLHAHMDGYFMDMPLYKETVCRELGRLVAEEHNLDFDDDVEEELSEGPFKGLLSDPYTCGTITQYCNEIVYGIPVHASVSEVSDGA